VEGQPGHEVRAGSVQVDLPVRGAFRGEPAVVGITGASAPAVRTAGWGGSAERSVMRTRHCAVGTEPVCRGGRGCGKRDLPPALAPTGDDIRDGELISHDMQRKVKTNKKLC